LIYAGQKKNINKPLSVTPVSAMTIIFASIISIVTIVIRTIAYRLSDESFSFFSQVIASVAN
jgi:hypothetical protein